MNLFQRIKNRIIYHTMIKNAENRNSKKDNINPQNTLMIFSSPRGGSTWLAEVLSTIPSSALCIEPLYQGVKELSDIGFFWHQPIPVDATWNEAKLILKKLFNREILRLNMYDRNNIRSLANSDTFIFKLCYGNLLLEWLTNEFDINPILLVRHPCAVVASQLKHPGWGKTINYNIPDFRYNEVYKQYEDILKTITTVEENYAATWCITMMYSLQSPANDKKWITVAYENLYENYEYEIERIFRRLGLKIPEDIYSKKHILSQTTDTSSANLIANKKQLSKWQKILSPSQQSNVMRIVEAFGIDCYNLDIRPDINKMYVSK